MLLERLFYSRECLWEQRLVEEEDVHEKVEIFTESLSEKRLCFNEMGR